MAKSSNQKLKILYLLQMLKEKTDEDHGLTLAEIISLLDEQGIKAERKSIYSNLEALREFGVDIEKRHGDSVTYHVVTRDFELPELKLLVDAVQASKFITHKKSSSLIKKIEGLAGKYQGQQLQRQVFVSNRVKTMNESIYYVVDDIHTAISSNRQIKFQYYEWNFRKEKQLRREGKVYQVSPWALTWDDENYYMIAYDEESRLIKHYRVDKMLSLKITEDKRLGSEHFKNFDMAVYSKRTFGMYGGEEKQVTLRCHNSMAGIVIDRFGQDITMYSVDNENFEVVVRIFLSPHFLTWIMNFSGKMRIVSPADVVEAYVKLAEEAVAAYRKQM